MGRYVRLCALTSFLVIAQFIVSHMAIAGEQAAANLELEAHFGTWLQALVGSEETATIGQINYDPDTETLSVSDVEVTATSAASTQLDGSPIPETVNRVRVEKILIKSPELQNGTLRFSDAILKNASMSSEEIGGDGNISVKELEIGAGQISSAKDNDIASLDNAGLSEIEKILSVTQFSRASAAGIEIFGSQIGGKLTLSNVKDRMIGDLTATDVNIPIELGLGGRLSKLQSANLRVESIHVREIDIEDYLNLLHSIQHSSSVMNWRSSSLFKELDMSKFNFDANALTISIAGGHIENMNLQPFGDEISTAFAGLAAEGATLAKRSVLINVVENALLDAISAEAIDFRNVDVFAPDKAGLAHFAADRIGAENVSARNIDSLDLTGLHVEDPQGAASLSQANFKGLKFPQMGVLHPGKAAVDAGEVVSDDARQTYPTVHEVAMNGIALKSEDGNLAIDRIYFGLNNYIGDVPTDINANISNVVLNVDEMPVIGLRQFVSDLGYRQIKVSLDFSANWLDASSSIDFHEVGISLSDMLRLTASGMLKGITRSSVSAPGRNFLPEALAGGVQNIRLSIDNLGLVDKMIDAVAKRTGNERSAVVANLSKNMPNLLSAISDPDIRNRFIFSLVAFLNDPTELLIESKTNDVIPMSSILSETSDPWQLPTLLKLDARAAIQN